MLLSCLKPKVERIFRLDRLGNVTKPSNSGAPYGKILNL